ncbi:MAG: DUF5615 family PIN-like protein [Cytophagaceae bacterium]|nr:DUF5615 family PIN-like protein [Cytophagaceae bacterium]
MKFLLDQNISRRICAKISPVFGEVTSAIEQGLFNANDREIWEFAKSHGYVLISQDKDHYDLSRLYGHPPKLILASLWQRIQSDNRIAFACLRRNNF